MSFKEDAKKEFLNNLSNIVRLSDDKLEKIGDLFDDTVSIYTPKLYFEDEVDLREDGSNSQLNKKEKEDIILDLISDDDIEQTIGDAIYDRLY